jgi:hypothetical protein
MGDALIQIKRAPLNIIYISAGGLAWHFAAMKLDILDGAGEQPARKKVLDIRRSTGLDSFSNNC